MCIKILTVYKNVQRHLIILVLVLSAFTITDTSNLLFAQAKPSLEAHLVAAADDLTALHAIIDQELAAGNADGLALALAKAAVVVAASDTGSAATLVSQAIAVSSAASSETQSTVGAVASAVATTAAENGDSSAAATVETAVVNSGGAATASYSDAGGSRGSNIETSTTIIVIQSTPEPTGIFPIVDNKPIVKLIEPLNSYTVVLDATQQMYKPGPSGEMKVWIGDNSRVPKSISGMIRNKDDIVTKTHKSVKIYPSSVGFFFDKTSSTCTPLDPEGTISRFEMNPKDTGTFNVSADIYLYADPNCTGLAIPRHATTLIVTVSTNMSELATQHAIELWQVFWEKILGFWGWLVAYILGLITNWVYKQSRKNK